MNSNSLGPPFPKTGEAKPHTPVYTMHKYFARRPWNVFSELISHYSSPDEIVLDPFCGGGVTIVESLKLKRRAVGIDVNPLATYVTEMQTKSLNLDAFQRAFLQLRESVEEEIRALYSTACLKCGGDSAADWIEWDELERKIIRLKYNCPACKNSDEKTPDRKDILLARKIEQDFTKTVQRRGLWFPNTRIPSGDKTDSLLNKKINYFHELFTRRNLQALSILLSEIQKTRDQEARAFLRFAFSSSLKWSSRQSHLRGPIVEGWAIHAYWIYQKSLEINVWNTFERRTAAIFRGKKYSNEHIGESNKPAKDFSALVNGKGSYVILNRSATDLPMKDRTVDAVITDPPYGANVNYGELSDFWFIWLSRGKVTPKLNEVIINRTQRKALSEYEELLYTVLKECHRVLKPNRYLVSTFNSKDVRIVSSFITAASRAGFTLDPNGITYQKPIRSYTTTIHAMQIGAFVGDFIFAFIKAPKSSVRKTSEPSLPELREQLEEMIERAERSKITEPELREGAYRILIPFLANQSQTNIRASIEAVDFFETKMREREPYFMNLRKTITRKRRRSFLNRQKP